MIRDKTGDLDLDAIKQRYNRAAKVQRMHGIHVEIAASWDDILPLIAEVERLRAKGRPIR